LAIDPGSKESGWCAYFPCAKQVTACGIDHNERMLCILWEDAFRNSPVVCEWVTHYGFKVGSTTFDTCRWVGRFEQSLAIPRWEVKRHWCGRPAAADQNVRAAVVERFGGTTKAAKGTKKKPGPLYGVKSHIWQAVALAVCYAETK